MFSSPHFVELWKFENVSIHIKIKYLKNTGKARTSVCAFSRRVSTHNVQSRSVCSVLGFVCKLFFQHEKKFHSWCGVTVVVWFHSRNLTALPTFKNYEITNSRCSLCSNINSTQLAPAIPPSAQVFLCCSTRVERDRFREIMCCFCATYFHFSRAFSAFSCVSSARTNKKKYNFISFSLRWESLKTWGNSSRRAIVEELLVLFHLT